MKFALKHEDEENIIKCFLSFFSCDGKTLEKVFTFDA